MMKKTLLFFLITIMFSISCKKDEPKPEPEGDIVIAENTKVINDDTRATITAIDPIDYTFTFDGSSTQGDNLKVGDIIVDGISDLAPTGYLRKITNVSKSKGGSVVQTEQVKLHEAIPKGKIHFSTGKLKIGQIESMRLAKGVKLRNAKNTDFTVFSLDYEKEFSNANGKATISGHTDLDIDFFFDYEWDFSFIPPSLWVSEFESGVNISQSAFIGIESAAGIGIDKRYSLAELYFTPWVFMVGPVPVVFYPRVELFVELDGSITGQFSTYVAESFNGKLGGRYTTDDDGENGQWSEINEHTFEKDVVAPNMDVEANFSADVGPEVSLLLYGIAGPFVNVTDFADLDSELHTDTMYWELTFICGSTI